MAFDAGSVVGHFTLDSSGWTQGAEKLNKSNAGMTGSVFKAQLAYDLFKKVLSGVVNFLKDSIKEYAAHALVVKQTEAVLKSTAYAAGLTKTEVVGLSESLMGLSNFEDDAILAAENLLLTFTKIGKDTFPQATQTILDMSTALGQDLKSSAIQLGKALQDPVLGVTALRRVGVNFNEEQIKTIKGLVESNRLFDAQQMILKELNTEFGGSAAAARDTFAGAVKALDFRIGDLKETMGLYITTIGKPFIETAVNMATSVNDFLTSTEGMEKIKSVMVPLAAVLSVAFDIGKQLFGMIKELAIGVIGDLKSGFTDLVGEGDKSNTVFLVLGGIVKGVSIGFAILGKSIKFGIDYMFNLLAIARDAGIVLYDLGDALMHPFDKSKWEKLGTDIATVWDSVKKTATDAVGDIKDIITTTIAEFKTFSTDAPKIGTQLQTTFGIAAASMDKTLTGVQNAIAGVTDALIVAGDTSVDVADEMVTSAEIVNAKWSDVASQGKQTWKGVFQELWDQQGLTNETWKMTFDELKFELEQTAAKFGWFSDQTGVAWTAFTKHIASGITEWVNQFSSAMNQIFDIYNMTLASEQTLADNDYQKKKAYIEANVTDATAKKAQLEALDAEYAAKTAEIKKKQFESNKAAAIINAIISTALAVVQALTVAPPFGFILAGIVAALGAIQIGVIASQPTPDFAAAQGGVFPPNSSILVGEEGPEILKTGQTSMISPNGSFGNGGITLDNKFYGDINSDVDMDNASRLQAMRIKRAVRS